MKRTIITAVFALGVTCGLMQAADEGQITNRKALRTAIANAKTPADHARIADYYTQRARILRDKQMEQERLAAFYAKNHPANTKAFSPYDHAKRLASYYGHEADQASSQAQLHTKLTTPGALAVEFASK